MEDRERDSEENNWGFGTDNPVDLAAGRMYGSKVKLVKEESENYDIQADRLRNALAASRVEADRSAAILVFALAEDIMLSGLQTHLKGEVTGGWSELSSGNGLLATANDRISLLALLGWIHPSVYSDLKLLKSIRNHFAHNPDLAGFDQERLKGYVSSLCPAEKAVMKLVGASDRALSFRQLYLARAANTLIRLVGNLAVAPAARRERIAPGHIDMTGWEELPANLQELNRILAEHVICILSPTEQT